MGIDLLLPVQVVKNIVSILSISMGFFWKRQLWNFDERAKWSQMKPGLLHNPPPCQPRLFRRRPKRTVVRSKVENVGVCWRPGPRYLTSWLNLRPPAQGENICAQCILAGTGIPRSVAAPATCCVRWFIVMPSKERRSTRHAPIVVSLVPGSMNPLMEKPWENLSQGS